MMTERMGRVWAWEQVKAAHPGVKVLLTPHDRPPHDFHPYELELFEAWGMSVDDIELFEAPVRPETLYSASSMFSLSDYLHPDLTAVWRGVGDRLATKASDRARPERLFVSRPQTLKRACHNSSDVEQLFARHGFEVMHPEEHPLSEQVAMVRSAGVIGGFVGSGLFTLALCPEPKQLFTVGSTSYTARNEQLIAAALGHSVVASWSRPDIAHPQDSWTQEAFFSDFSFDIEREGAFLQRQLERLAH
jgi:capsular polysaccharide biosynthesis protein